MTKTIKIGRDNVLFRHVLLHYFDMKTNVAEAYNSLMDPYGVAAPSKIMSRKLIQRFKEGDFDVRVKKRPDQPKNDSKLQELLENPAQNQKSFQKPSASTNQPFEGIYMPTFPCLLSRIKRV